MPPTSPRTWSTWWKARSSATAPPRSPTRKRASESTDRKTKQEKTEQTEVNRFLFSVFSVPSCLTFSLRMHHAIDFSRTANTAHSSSYGKTQSPDHRGRARPDRGADL